MKHGFFLVWTVMLILSVALYFQIKEPKPFTSLIGLVTSVTGVAHVRLPEAPMWLGLQEGQKLSEGSVVATNANASVHLQLNQGQTLQIGPSTQVYLTLQNEKGELGPSVTVVSGQIRVVQEAQPKRLTSFFGLATPEKEGISFKSLEKAFADLKSYGPSFNPAPQVQINAGDKWIRVNESEASDVAVKFTGAAEPQVVVVRGSAQLNGQEKIAPLSGPKRIEQINLVDSIMKATQAVSQLETEPTHDNFQLEKNWAMQNIKFSNAVGVGKQICLESIKTLTCPPLQIAFAGPSGVNFREIKVKFWMKLTFEGQTHFLPLNVFQKNTLRSSISSLLLRNIQPTKQVSLNTNYRSFKIQVGLSPLGGTPAEAEFSTESFVVEVLSIADLTEGNFFLTFFKSKQKNTEPLGWRSADSEQHSDDYSTVWVADVATLTKLMQRAHRNSDTRLKFQELDTGSQDRPWHINVYVEGRPILSATEQFLNENQDLAQLVADLNGDFAFVGNKESYEPIRNFTQDSTLKHAIDSVYLLTASDLVKLDSRLLFESKATKNIILQNSLGIFFEKPLRYHLKSRQL